MRASQFQNSSGTQPRVSGLFAKLPLIGIGIIYLVFFALVMSSVRPPHKGELTTNANALLASIAKKGSQSVRKCRDAGVQRLFVKRRLNRRQSEAIA